MTIRYNLRKTSLSIAHHGLLYGLMLASLTGCGSILESDRISYKSTGKVPTLEVPPDLTQLQRDNRYAISEVNQGMATASAYNLQQSVRPKVAAAVVPNENGTQDIRIERAGNQRWLVVRKTPGVLWPQVKDFWQDLGFLISLDVPEAGVMETDWAENRAKIPQDIIRSTLGKALDSLYSTGERDKFRTRFERGTDGTTEIYISHRGAQEVLVGQQKERTVWTPRSPDPELEAEFLSRLMAKLGVEETRAKAAIANPSLQSVHAKLLKGGNGSYVEVDEGFDRAWRRVGLALDRVGFTVEDRDRMQGLYFVRYIDQDQEAKSKSPSEEKGLLSRLFSFGVDDKAKSAQRYRVSVKGLGGVSQIVILDNDGHPQSSQTADKILFLLIDQLK